MGPAFSRPARAPRRSRPGALARPAGTAAALAVLLAAAIGGPLGCSDGSGEGGRPSIEVVSVSGATPGPNPVTGAAAPAGLDRATALVYRDPGTADVEVERVLVLMPGFLAGAGTFDYMARRLVERSGGAVSVWAVDRRSNALEDQTGLDAAERARDPEVAKGYYFRGEEVDGRTFAGFLAGAGDLGFLSEWGLRAHVEDLDALLAAARARHPRAALFLGGHSLGASIAPIYAAWRFAGGRAGFEDLSGVVLLEGAPSPAPPGAVPDRGAYEAGLTGLAGLRGALPVSSIPFVGPDLYVTAGIIGMRASPRFGQPTALSPDADLFGGFFRLLFPLETIPPTTNRAVLGTGFDDGSEPVPFLRVAVGEADGPVGPNPRGALFSLVFGGGGGDLVTPTDPTFTYDWLDRDAQARRDPGAAPDPTALADFAELTYAGPADLIEWYFPGRIALDVGAATGLNVAPAGDWRLDAYGLAVTENARVDVPVFAAGGSIGLVPESGAFRPYLDSIAPVLRDGTPRAATPVGFSARIMAGHAHIDVVSAEDRGGDPAVGNGLFQPLLDWMVEAERLAPPR